MSYCLEPGSLFWTQALDILSAIVAGWVSFHAAEGAGRVSDIFVSGLLQVTVSRLVVLRAFYAPWGESTTRLSMPVSLAAEALIRAPGLPHWLYFD